MGVPSRSDLTHGIDKGPEGSGKWWATGASDLPAGGASQISPPRAHKRHRRVNPQCFEFTESCRVVLVLAPGAQPAILDGQACGLGAASAVGGSFSEARLFLEAEDIIRSEGAMEALEDEFARRFGVH